MLKLPTLYKKSSTGALLQWEVAVEQLVEPEYDGAPDGYPGVIVTRHGQVGGSIQESREAIRKGKNVGRANATTPYQQAEAEAQSEWNKKVQRQGYVEDRARAEQGETDAEGGIAPMLAHPIGDVHPKNISWPMDVQRKFDGNRILVVVEDGDVSLWSRRRERVEALPHIKEAYRKLCADLPGRWVFDGESYRHGWSLQKIASFTRQKLKPKEGHEELWHLPYDVPSVDGPWSMRRAVLAEMQMRWGLLEHAGPVRRVDTFTVGSQEEFWAMHDRFVAEGYEGIIGRQEGTRYEAGKRSNTLLKGKVFEDHEFTIVGVTQGRGKFEGLAMFQCVTDAGKPFDCCAPGTFEDRAAYLRDAANLVGKRLTVKHKGWSDDGIPLYVVGKAVRDYE